MTSPHFAWLPPEINSALIFAGPGAAPLLAAAAAWDGLAEKLASSASSFWSVTSDLANGFWQGAPAAAMLALATKYVNWLSAAAAQAEAVSSQASAIAAAFEAALSATVQPAVVAANRALAQALAATNWLGQNTPAIADIEAAYEQMWASDVAAMFGYHADACAAAADLPPWQHVLETLDFHFGNGGAIGFPDPGTGQIGLVNSGHGSLGILCSGDANTGSASSGSFAAGVVTPPGGTDAGMLGSGREVTGDVGAASVGSGLLNASDMPTGGVNPGVASPDLLNPVLPRTAVIPTAGPGAIAGNPPAPSG